MQTAVPELMDVSRESRATQELYGMFEPFEKTRNYAHQCLVARRLIERGVRFVELTCPQVAADRWDQHSRLREGHELNALRHRPTDRRPAHRSQIARAVAGHAGDLGRRIRTHADGPRQRRPRPQSVRLHDLDGRRRREAGLRLRQRPTNTATTRSKTSSRSTTCTRRCCTCSDWTTSS